MCTQPSQLLHLFLKNFINFHKIKHIFPIFHAIITSFSIIKETQNRVPVPLILLFFPFPPPIILVTENGFLLTKTAFTYKIWVLGSVISSKLLFSALTKIKKTARLEEH